MIKVTSKNAPSSCEGQFGNKSNRDEGYPTSVESIPSIISGGGSTFSIPGEQVHMDSTVIT